MAASSADTWPTARLTGRAYTAGSKPGRAANLLLVTACFAVSPDVGAQTESRWYANATVGTDRIHYGYSQVDTGTSVELGADYQHASGTFFGASISNADYATDAFVGISRSEQLWLYAGFAWNKPEWLINASVGRYVYPDIAIDYDYTMWSVGVVFRNRFLASVRYTDDLLAIWGSAIEYEVGFAWPLPADFELGGTIGRFDARNFFGTEHSQWNIGVSRTMGRIGIDARFHDTNARRITPLGYPASDTWVFSFSYALKS